MSAGKLIKEIRKKGLELPTGKIPSVFPSESTKVTREFLNTKSKIETVKVK